MSACNTHPSTQLSQLVIVTISELVIVNNGDDWEGVYRDGKLVHEEHSTGVSTLAVIAGGQPFTLEYVGEQQNFADHAEETGRAPELLADALDDVDPTP